MAIGVPVAITFLTTNIIGWLVFNDWYLAAIDQVVDKSTILITRFTLGPVLMFILMGSLFFTLGSRSACLMPWMPCLGNCRGGWRTSQSPAAR